ncbi:hypothetical protein QBC34DRAFT_417254 [Podospora aff. communis PSN243]|uniref:Mitochondrial transcription factor 1 n=1 Tax=Podospora aff. communis PSN243 TaxID=3040156 RepID=A0AAV9G5C2_9PEZI|nr:hypothetical protein QBC34DRAFT_417254 [Podospora aff. communis PSN243]
MLTLRNHARRTLQSLPGGCMLLPARNCTARPIHQSAILRKNHIANPSGDVAERLEGTGLWKQRRPRHLKGVDNRRVHITNPALVSDILNYIGPSLKRHEGCDLIDINPGAGVWSSGLHDLLRPRSHILLEPNAEFYKSFLQPLLDKPGVVLEAKNGIDWADLNEIMTPKYLPHQVEKPRTFGPDSEPPQRNDTLLVTVNLAAYAPRRFLSFDSLALLVMHQLQNSIRTRGLFQKYGLVRMLVWLRPEDTRASLAYTVQKRRRAIIDAELNTEWIREVAGLGVPDMADRNPRHTSRSLDIDLQSALNAALRMREAGIEAPPERQSIWLSKVQPFLDEGLTEVPKLDHPDQGAHVISDFEQMEKAFAAGEIAPGTPAYKLYTKRKNYHKWLQTRSTQKEDMLREMKLVRDLWEAGNTEEATKANEEWSRKVASRPGPVQTSFIKMRDNEHIFYQDPPLLHWDRRPYEPLMVRADDFYPRMACTLLDIQPKAPHWLVRDMGRNSLYRAGDSFELILRLATQAQSRPLSKTFEQIWPGATESVLHECPSLRDIRRNGSPVTGHGELTARCLNEAQWVEILQAWVNWPFKPTFSELVYKVMDHDVVDDGPGNKGGAKLGGGNFG